MAVRHHDQQRSPADPPSGWRRRFAGDPVRRAFSGLALGLALGFVPAAYYARAVNGAEVGALRAEQSAMSARPASAEVLARFDALDAGVRAARSRGVALTLVIWVVAGGAVGAAWARLSAGR